MTDSSAQLGQRHNKIDDYEWCDWESNDGQGFQLGIDSSGNAIVENRENTNLTFYTNNNPRITVLAGGNVGIGATPSTKLHLGGTAPGDSIIRQDSTASGTNWEIGERAAGKWQIFEDDTDSIVATFMSSGNVGIGTDSPSTVLDVNGLLGVGNARVHETRVNQTLALTAAAQRGGMSINSWYNSAAGPLLDFNVSRNNTAGSHTVIQDNDALGTIIFRGDDGDEFKDAAAIEANVDASPGNDDMAGRLVFYTAPDGSQGLQERMRIDNQGRVTKPSNPSFQVRCSGVNNINASGGYTVPYGGHSVQHNVGSHFNTSNYRFTAPIAGSYLFSASLRVDDFSSNAQYSYITLKHYNSGGTAQSDKGRDLSSSTGNYKHHAIVSVVYLAAGDYVNVQLVTFNDTSTDLNDDSWFSGYLLG